MALATYSDLKASLSTWTDGADLSATDSDLIALAEAEINAQLSEAIKSGAMIRPMVSISTITISGEYAAIPDAAYSMIQPISMEVVGLSAPWPVTYTAPENLVDLKRDQDCARSEIYTEIQDYPPRHYTFIGDNIRFFPAPQSTYSAEFTRFVRVPALSASNPTNWVLTNHPNVYLYGALAQAELLGWNDERVSNLAALFMNAVNGMVGAYPTVSDRRPLRSDIPVGFRYGSPC